MPDSLTSARRLGGGALILGVLLAAAAFALWA